MNEMKQEIYASCSLDQATSADNLDAMGQRVAKLDRDNNALRDELDTRASMSLDLAGDLPIFDEIMTISRSPDFE